MYGYWLWFQFVFEQNQIINKLQKEYFIRLEWHCAWPLATTQMVAIDLIWHDNIPPISTSK